MSVSIRSVTGNTRADLFLPGVQSAFTAEVFEDTAMKDMANSLHPFRGLGTPDDIAPIAVFLASDDARWVTGHGLVVDGGYTAR